MAAEGRTTLGSLWGTLWCETPEKANNDTGPEFDDSVVKLTTPAATATASM